MPPTSSQPRAATSRHVPLLRVFLSSPSDVHNERLATERILTELPDRPSFRDRVAVRTVSWSTPSAGTPLLGHLSPQEAITRGLPRPSECDIVIVLFWSRLGTPFTDAYGRTFRSGTHWELLDAIEADHPRTMIYASTREVKLTADDLEAQAQLRALESFMRSELFYQDGEAIRGINHFRSVDDLRALLRTHLEEVVSDWLDSFDTADGLIDLASPSPAVATSSRWEGSPFPGLRAFTIEDEPIYHGRERATDELLELVAARRFAVVVGTSGSGKSSLVHAGLLPRLAANAIAGEQLGSKDWTVVAFRPGSDPFTALAAALLRGIDALKVDDPIDVVERRDRFAASLRRQPTYLRDTLEFALAEAVDWAQVLIVIDQFEEVLASSDEATLAALLATLRESGPRVRVLVTLRADFYARALEVMGEELRAGSFSLGVPSGFELYDMITRPAERAGLRFERGLAERIVAETGRDPGALPLLAYALDNLYQASQADGRQLLTTSSYEAMGGVQGAIAQRAEAVVTALELGEDELADLRQQVFFRLVTVNEQGVAVRRRAPLSELGSDPKVASFVDQLVAARLVVRTASDDGTPCIEVAHEALLHRWQRLADAIERIQDDLVLLRHVRHSAEEWQRRGENPAFLWAHELLTFVDDMLERLGNPPLDPVTARFVRPESERLLDEIGDPLLDPRRRAGIGQRLAQIGDPRRGVGVEDGTPAIDWVLIPGGTRTIARRSAEAASFYLSRYCVTHAQFESLLAAGGDLDRWWTGLGVGPDSLEVQQTSLGNHPRDSVRWADAVAFTRWLDHLWQRGELPAPDDVAGADPAWTVRLPLEWEWELAAGGTSPGRRYPWGDRFDPAAANTREAGLSQTCAVGMFPAGRSPDGIEDLSGNIAEWCLNLVDDPFIYGGTEQMPHVRKGGSCNHPAAEAQVAARFRGSEGYRFSHDMGFRVVLAGPPLTGRWAT